MHLIPWLAGAFTGITGWFATWLSAKAAMAAAAVTALGVVWLAFAVSITGAVVALSVSLPAWAVGGVMFLPSNLSACISALITAKLAKMVFDYQKETIRLISYIT
jgi:hypothetical protein